MGIELPTPQGEALSAAHGSNERPTFSNNGERPSNSNSVEINATERPSFQEVKTDPGASDGSSATSQTDANASTPTMDQSLATPPAVSLDDVPVIAADEDLIEKQWVDSAKRIIEETRSDPYRQGEAINRLQADYLQKRYGKTRPGSETS